MGAGRSEHAAICGLCWGDEGKGKAVDLLAPAFDVVIRYNGGANAGHTVCVGGERFALHLMPTGVLHPGVIGVIGPGVVLDPGVLLQEIETLNGRGIEVGGRLKISDRAHVVTEYHKIEDRLSEQAAGDAGKIGTTARGIGPCYADKMKRLTAWRVCDLLDSAEAPGRFERIIEIKRRTFEAVYGDDGRLDAGAIWRQLTADVGRLREFICDTTLYLLQALDDGRRLLFEGANGMLLDVDHGTYPFVTASSTGPWGVSAGAGVPPQTVGHYVGVAKAYCTRVGSGPFPSELYDSTSDYIRQRGREFGTTTGRPRRCGWFDAVAVRHNVRLGGITEIALMHLDTLSGLEQIGICSAYQVGGRTYHHLPADGCLLANAEPVLERHAGWGGELGACTRFEDLPAEAIRYIERVETLAGAPITLVGVGPDRSQTLFRGGPASVFSSVAADGAR